MPSRWKHNPLRQEAERIAGGAVRLDRGAGLYYAPAEGLLPSGLLTAAIRQDGGHASLMPTEDAARAFWAWAMPQLMTDSFLEQLAQRQQQPITAPELELFTQGMKQLELNVAPMIWLHYDKRIRQLSAECLRTERGGGALCACWAAMMLGLKGVNPK